MAAVRNRNVADGHVMAELEGHGLVGAAVVASQRTTGNQAASGDGDVFDAVAPDQAVVPVAMARILVLRELVRLGGVVGRRVGNRFQGGARFDVQRDAAA